jgi:hypothetical protein
MTKSELKQLIRETIEEQTLDRGALSKQALEVINFLRNNEDQIASGEQEKQILRRVWGVYLQDLLTDEDYKKLHPGSNIGKVGGGDREDFAKGT